MIINHKFSILNLSWLINGTSPRIRSLSLCPGDWSGRRVCSVVRTLGGGVPVSLYGRGDYLKRIHFSIRIWIICCQGNYWLKLNLLICDIMTKINWNPGIVNGLWYKLFSNWIVDLCTIVMNFYTSCIGIELCVTSCTWIWIEWWICVT